MTLSAVAVAAAWWVQRPTIDFRLVGTWRLEGEPRIGVTYSAEGWFVLLRDGKPLWDHKNCIWFVRRGVLHKIVSGRDLISDVCYRAQRLYSWLNGYESLPMHFEQHIAEVNDSTLRFYYPDGEQKWTRAR